MLIQLTLAFILTSVSFAEKTLTNHDLLSGSKIPEKRNFPLSTKVAPCDNFYEYVCGPVVSNFQLPKDKSSWSFSFTDLDEKILHARKKYLKHLQSFIPSSERGKSLRNFYLSCMNASASAKEEKSIVAEKTKLIDGMKTREELVKYIAAQINTANFAFVNYSATPNQDDPNEFDLILVAHGTTYPEKSYYTKEENLKALQNIITEFFKTIGTSNPEVHAKNVVDFEKEYAQADLERAQYRERFSSRNTVTRSTALKDYQELDLDQVFKKIPSKTKIRVPIPETVAFIHSALKNKSMEVLKDVFLYRTLNGYLDDAYPQYFAKRFKFNHEILGGPEKRLPRDERCAREITGSFGKEFDTELISILFKDFPESQVDQIVSKIRSTLIEEISENTWLSKSAKAEAIKKIEVAKLYLVQPKNEKEWDYNPPGNYSALTPYANRLQLDNLLIEKELKELFEARDRTRWLMAPLTLNAYYMPPDNKFTLLQGILQFPFFDAKSSLVENLAAIGMVTGHELGHGIDDQGSKYDSEGRLRSWLSEKDLNSFHERTARFVDQFNKVGHNGQLTLGENIGDHVGLSTAYRAAFGKDGKGSIEDKKKFFVAYSRMWCSKMLPKYQEMRLKTDPHAMGFARVNQQVMHLDGFYDAYSCKAGDPMYLDPKNRVKVW